MLTLKENVKWGQRKKREGGKGWGSWCFLWQCAKEGVTLTSLTLPFSFSLLFSLVNSFIGIRELSLLHALFPLVLFTFPPHGPFCSACLTHHARLPYAPPCDCYSLSLNTISLLFLTNLPILFTTFLKVFLFFSYINSYSCFF